MNSLVLMHEGFHNAPSLYGADVRKLGKVTDFKSGLVEGGRVSTDVC
jgi:sterol 3beta-glucosyltransferase